jgi:hypothetical protein
MPPNDVVSSPMVSCPLSPILTRNPVEDRFVLWYNALPAEGIGVLPIADTGVLPAGKKQGNFENHMESFERILYDGKMF